MSVIAFNATIRITDKDFKGFYRVVAIPSGYPNVFLAVLPEAQDSAINQNAPAQKRLHVREVNHELLLHFETQGELCAVEVEPEPQLRKRQDQLSDTEVAKHKYRAKVMADFLDHEKLSMALTSRRGLGVLVRAAMAATGSSRSSVYRLFDLLCLHGFGSASLNPRNDRMGAPGVRRPCGARRKSGDTRKKAGRKTRQQRLKIDDPNPQKGTSEDQATKIIAAYQAMANPKPKGKQLYDLLIKNAIVTSFVQTPAGLAPVMPPQGTYPNQREVRYLLTTLVPKLDRLLSRTTTGHFARNLRGLKGYAWQGIAGPGHCFAIDSTIGDVYLRSSINRAWITGRPIVYIVVDVWSTAIVGFYVCWSGPSWEMAKCALFSTFADPRLLGELWGYVPAMALDPLPTAPYLFLCDRGEYLSKSAHHTAGALGFGLDYNPSYRPDLKGLVEVLNRIAKDQQYFFVPGAIDARRKELEMRTDPRESAYTLREYVQYLYWIFTQYNMFSDRSHRMRSEMIAANVDPTPAGLWRFGHQARIGYRKIDTLANYITNLLPSAQAVIGTHGISLGQLKYEYSGAAERNWTALARNFGTQHLQTHRFPGSTSRIWWPDPNASRIETFTLSPYARAPADICFDEWLDAYEYEQLRKKDREHQRLCASIAELARIGEQSKRAVALTAEAEAAYSGPKPSTHETRSMEKFADAPTAPTNARDINGDAGTQSVPAEDESSRLYNDLMRQVLEAK